MSKPANWKRKHNFSLAKEMLLIYQQRKLKKRIKNKNNFKGSNRIAFQELKK